MSLSFLVTGMMMMMMFANTYRQLSQFTGGSCTIAKLFAKHMKASNLAIHD